MNKSKQTSIKELLLEIHNSNHIGCVITDEEIDKVKKYFLKIIEEEKPRSLAKLLMSIQEVDAIEEYYMALVKKIKGIEDD